MGIKASKMNNVLKPMGELGTIVKALALALSRSYGAPHVKPDTVNVTTATTPTDQASTNTYIHNLKDRYNAHLGTVALVHASADTTNTIAAADPDDLAKCLTAINEIKADLLAHLANATCHTQPDTVSGTITTEDATDLATCKALAVECWNLYYDHAGFCMTTLTTYCGDISALV